MELPGVFMLKSIRHIFSLLEVDLEDIKLEIEEFATYDPDYIYVEDEQRRNRFMLYSMFPIIARVFTKK